VWSKNFATQNVSLYGLLTVQVSSADPADLHCSLLAPCPVCHLKTAIIWKLEHCILLAMHVFLSSSSVRICICYAACRSAAPRLRLMV
jgi:hypothetical protein